MNTFIICASGPSLNKSDCELISGSGLPVIAVNSTWQAVPDCEYIYAGDLRWWDANIDVLPSSASRWTCNYRAHKRYGLNLFDTDTRWAFNSGQGQFDALVSFTYNLGARSLSTSTLLRKLNAGDYAGAADEFLRWNKAGGKVLTGLTRRREAERALFLS